MTRHEIAQQSFQLCFYAVLGIALSIPLSKTGIGIFAIAGFAFGLASIILDPSRLIEVYKENKTIFLSFILFLAYCALSLLWGTHPDENISGLSKWSRDFLIFFLFLFVCKSLKNYKQTLFFLLAGALMASLNGLYQFLSGTDLLSHHQLMGRINSTFHVAPFFSAYLVLVIPLALTHLLKKPLSFKNMALFLILTLTFILTFTRNTMVWLSLIGFVTIAYHSKLKLIHRIPILLTIMIGILFVPLPGRTPLHSLLRSPASNASFVERHYLWKISKNMISDKPLLGHGLNSYSKINVHYFPKNFSALPQNPGYLSLAYPHNSFLKIWIEIGLVGLVLYGFILTILFREVNLGWSHLEPEAKFSITLFLVGLTSFLGASIFAEFLVSSQTRTAFWAVIGLAVGLLRLGVLKAREKRAA